VAVASTTSAPAAGAERASGDLVDAALSDFYPVHRPALLGLIRKLWWLQLLLIPLDWVLYSYLGGGGWQLLLLLTPHVFFSIAALLAYRAMGRLRYHLLCRLWDRGVIAERKARDDPMRQTAEGEASGLLTAPKMRDRALAARGNIGTEEQYVSFIRRFDSQLNRNGIGLLIGLVFAGMFYVFFPMAGFRPGFPLVGESIPGWVRVVLAIDLAAQAFLVVIVGLVAWRLVVVAWEIWHLAGDFDLDLQWQHPDKSGGLGPLGDACFSIAAVWAVVAIYPATWLVLLRYGTFDNKRVSDLIQLAHSRDVASSTNVLHQLEAYTAGLLLLTIVFAVLTFWVPLYFVHRAMIRQRPALFRELDELGRLIHVGALRVERLTEQKAGASLPPGAPSPVDGQSSIELDPETARSGELLPHGIAAPTSSEQPRSELDGATDELSKLSALYAANAAIPAWPFDVKVLLKFLGAIIVPLTGVTVWLPKLIGNLFGAG